MIALVTSIDFWPLNIEISTFNQAKSIDCWPLVYRPFPGKR
jgi:hypothetical protein